MANSTDQLPLPTYDDITVVVPAPGEGVGNWAGAASAVLVDGVFWLTWRERRPLTDGRGVAVHIARSRDGVHFDEVAQVLREDFGAESFERPVLVPVPGIGWRLYLSCATPGSKHWWVDTLTAPSPETIATGERRITLTGDRRTAVKDPVIRALPDGGWEMYLCCHPLDEPGHEDRMTSRRLTSVDGLEWVDHGEVLAGRPGAWDERGARVTTVIADEPLTVLYDGRPDAASNWYEQTGVAVWDGERFVAHDADPLGSPYGEGALRYACAVPLPDGSTRFYIEAARPDGAHDLVTLVSNAR
ncbi:MAG TPA: hypothetical protein VHZ06_04235 [Marmoricola sp.]|nr:hypothetical protein [Marmoricola sp.]